MSDRLVIKGDYEGIDVGNLVVVEEILPSDTTQMLSPGDVGVVLHKTFSESLLGDDQSFLSPVLVVLAKGMRYLISPSAVTKILEDPETEERNFL
jgi:hypothetical protein